VSRGVRDQSNLVRRQAKNLLQHEQLLAELSMPLT
jgi:hypothetical protein